MTIKKIMLFNQSNENANSSGKYDGVNGKCHPILLLAVEVPLQTWISCKYTAALMSGGWASEAATLIQEVNFLMILRTLLKVSTLGVWCKVTPVFLLASWRSWLAPHQTEILQPLQKSLWLASSETIAALWTNKSPQSVAMAGYFRKPIQCQICSFYHIFIIADDGIILPDQLTIQIFDEPTLSLLSFGRSLFIMVDDDHLRKTSYSADFQNWGRALNFGKLVNQAPRPKTNAISLWCSFPKLRACPQFWKSGQPATPSKEKCFLRG